MASSALSGPLLLLALLAAALAALLGREAVPSVGETPRQYASRLVTRGATAVEELYLQLLLAVPGSLEVKVTSAADAAAEGEAEKESAVQKQDKLVQEVAKDEDQISAQQEVSAKRYAEAKRERSQEEEPLILARDQPDDVRGRMPTVEPTGPEMRCGQKLLPESSLTTRGIELQCRSEFQGHHSGQYGWKYVVTFKNKGSETVQMLTRHWIFVNSQGKLETEVKGPGARGVTPVLPPGGEWSYESGTSLGTAYGSMHGSFQFEVLKGAAEGGLRSFSARVGRLLLSSKAEAKGRKVPCLPAEPEGAGQLPLTSVMAIERVILGGRAEAMGPLPGGEYGFFYDVQFNNARGAAVEVLEHSWEVVDSEGKRHVASKGKGVGGSVGRKKRSLAAGDAFRVQGRLTSPTSKANAQGTYKVLLLAEEGEERREIEVRTDWLGLAAEPEVTHVPNFVADPRLAR